MQPAAHCLLHSVGLPACTEVPPEKANTETQCPRIEVLTEI